MIWGYLVHLSFNMWSDRPVGYGAHPPALRKLEFDDDLWHEILARLAGAGGNMVVIDLGDAVRYRSHPEIAIRGAWSVAKLKRQLAIARRLGLEPIPKLNFSACHDHWLGPYSRMVSTPAYYRACRDLIAEVCRIFGKPRFFHLGMDEETPQHQRGHQYVVVRQHGLWWHDFHFLRREVQRHGVRPWLWSDYIWHHAGEFRRQMPRSVLQSNWYYAASFSEKIRYVNAYLELDRLKYDQVPAATAYVAEDWAVADSFPRTVRFCARRLGAKRLKGFLQTLWRPTTREWRKDHRMAIDQLHRGVEAWGRRRG